MESSSSAQPRESPTIIAETQSLQTRFPLQNLQAELKTLLRTLLNALPGTTSFPALQTRLEASVSSTIYLFKRTLATLSLFHTATQKNIDDVTLSQQLLSDNLLTPAQKILSKSVANNTCLVEASNKLAHSFEKAADDLWNTLTEAHHTKQAQITEAVQLEQTKQESVVNLKQAYHLQDLVYQKKSEASSLYSEAERKEVSARRRGTLLHVAHVSAVVVSVLTTGSIALALSLTGVAALAVASDRHAAHAHDELTVRLRDKNDARDEITALEIKVTETEERILRLQREADVAYSVLHKLPTCVWALRESVGIMITVERFWKEVGASIDGGIVEMVDVGARLPEEERRAFWEGDKFRGRVDRIVEFWTAVGIVCQRSLDGVGGVATCDETQGEELGSSMDEMEGPLTHGTDGERYIDISTGFLY